MAKFFQTNSEKRKVRDEAIAQAEKDATWDEDEEAAPSKKRANNSHDDDDDDDDDDGDTKGGTNGQTAPPPAVVQEPIAGAAASPSEDALAAVAEEERLLSAAIASGGAQIKECLTRLRGCVTSIGHLKGSGVGKLVRGLKKHADAGVAATAKAMIAEWKAMRPQQEQQPAGS